MPVSHGGELAALVTALCWTVTALAFEAASRRVGSLTVNIVRLFLAFVFLTIFSMITRGMPLPFDATGHGWLWLGISGLVGFVAGDLLLFRAFVLVGARVSMLVMTLAPPLAALGGRLVFGERLGTAGLAGMALTLCGIALVVVRRGGGKERFALSRSPAGLLFAFGGALGQAVGLVLSKYGMRDYNAFSATHIRIIAGMAGFSLLFLATGRWRHLKERLSDGRAMGMTALGAFFGPFLGVSLSLYAVQHAETGIAATIMALVPVFIIVPSVLMFRERVTPAEVLGAFIAVGGTALMFMS